jgi:serine/threonine protein phosphatase PrpC
MYCPTCNTLNRDDAKFCKSCGHPLHVNVAAQAIAPTPDEAEANPVGADVSRPAPIDRPPTPTQTNTEEIEDISTAPTEILSPERMTALHNRLWQQDQEREQQYNQATASELQAAQAGMANGNADMPTARSEASGAHIDTSLAPDEAEANPVGADVSRPAPIDRPPAQDVADMPTARSMPPHEDETVPIPPPQISQTQMASVPAEVTQEASPPSSSQQSSGAADMTNEATSTGDGGAINLAPTQGKSDTMQQTSSDHSEQSERPEQTATSPTGDFSTLPVGTMMLDRYEITQVISESQQEHIYQVVDRQGYQHCWNCGSEQNAEGDEFCIDCGASMLNAPYIMHEYGTAGAPSTDDQHDAHVLQGNIVNTFVEQGRTYMIEQLQEARNAFPNGVHLLAVADSDAGDVRRSEPNEDSTLVLQLQRVHESMAIPAGVFIVADGLGGHDNGQVASRMTINIIAERMVRELLGAPLASEKGGGQAILPDEDGLVAMFHGAIEDANTTLVQMNQRDKTDMGSTITGFMVVGEHAYIINVGDSRTYMMRGKQLYQLTTDHSLVGQLVAGGLIEPDEVYTHPQRSQIFRSLGDKLNVQIDVFKQQLHPGDILLSCSDGLWEMVRNPQIESILNEAPDPQTACTQLIEAANTNGGEDNVSAVLVYVR